MFEVWDAVVAEDLYRLQRAIAAGHNVDGRGWHIGDTEDTTPLQKLIERIICLYSHHDWGREMTRSDATRFDLYFNMMGVLLKKGQM
jgi:hypothetical protein